MLASSSSPPAVSRPASSDPASSGPASPGLASGPAAGTEEPLRIIERHGRTYWLLGTAHVSARSTEAVVEQIEAHHPQTVCVELCPTRAEAIENPSRWQHLDLFQVIRRGQAALLLMQLLLAGFQQRLGARLGVRPGEEMRCAMVEAKKRQLNLVFADREIRITLRRAWQAMRWRERGSLFLGLFADLFSEGTAIDAAAVEELKRKDLLSELIETLARKAPGLKRTLLDERDAYLARRIADAPGERILAVLGAAHIPGVAHLLETDTAPTQLDALESVPPRRLWLRVLPWLLPLLVLGLFAYGFTRADATIAWELAGVWLMANGSLAALGAILALGHPLSVLVAMLAAPITSLNPLIAAGWFAGLTEAFLRKPKVRDLERLPEDLRTLNGFWRNRVTRVLLVVALANLGSTLGSLIGVPWILSLLA